MNVVVVQRVPVIAPVGGLPDFMRTEFQEEFSAGNLQITASLCPSGSLFISSASMSRCGFPSRAILHYWDGLRLSTAGLILLRCEEISPCGASQWVQRGPFACRQLAMSMTQAINSFCCSCWRPRASTHHDKCRDLIPHSSIVFMHSLSCMFSFYTARNGWASKSGRGSCSLALEFHI
jgi:hypothetical protein